MKKSIIALLLAVVMASSNVGTVPVMAAETTAEEAVAIEEETAEEAVAIEEETVEEEVETTEEADAIEMPEMTTEGEIVGEEETAESEEAPAETEEVVIDEIAEDATDMESSSEQLTDQESVEGVLTDSSEGSTYQTETAIEDEQDVLDEVIEETEEDSASKTAYNFAGMGSVWFGSYFQDKVTDPSEIELIKSEGLTKPNNYGVVSGVPIYCDGNRNYFRFDPVEWIIIKDDGDSYTLLSKKVLWNGALTDLSDSDHFWEGCKLRRYLNGDFYNTCFSDEEKNGVLETAVANHYQTYEQWSHHEEAQTTYTYDQVYLLHSDDLAAEAASDLVAYPTEYADSSGNAVAWWLRGESFWSYGNEKTNFVNSDGSIKSGYPTFSRGVRPVIQVRKDAEGLYFEKPEKKEILALDEIDSGFELLKDNNSFEHNTSNFLAPGENHYCISDRLYGILKKRANLVQWAHLHDNRYIYNWAGSCAGLSIMMALIDNGIHDFFIHEAGSFYNISSPIDIDGLRDTINYYFLLYNCNIAKTDRTVNKGQNISGFLKSVVAEAKRGKPFIFLYKYNEKRVLTSAEINEITEIMKERKATYHPTGGHAVVVCGYEYVETNNGEKEHRVKIYDCNGRDSFYWMYISDDYSSSRYQDANMSSRATILNDPSKINLFSSFTSMDFITFNSIERESHALDAITKSNTLNHNMMLADNFGEAYLASSSDSSDTTRVIISLDNPFVLTNEAGKSLTYDGIDISGDLPVYDSFISGEDYLELQFETDKSSRFTVSGYEEGTTIITQVGETVYSVDADKASDILIDEDAGVSISGNDVLFNVSSVNSINTNEIIAVSGNAESDCNIIRSDNSMIVTSDDTMSDVGIQVENDAGYKEYSIDSEKDNYIISYESDTPTATTKSEEGTFETVVISENGGEPVSASISSAEIDLSFETAVYTGEPLVPDITAQRDGVALQAGRDYSVSCENNTNVGTATIMITGIGSYTGTVEKTFEITPKTITPTITLSQASFVYNGSAQKPSVTVKDADNTVLTEGTDYTVSYTNNTNAGTASVTVTGKGNYLGTGTKTFAINKAAQSIMAKSSAATVSVGKTATVSTTGAKGVVTYSSSNAAVATVDSKTGVVTAKKVGTVTLTAQSAATANYSAASKSATVKVVPAATSSLSAANLSTGIKLTWKKVAGANGYLIYRNGTKIKTITSGSTVTYSDTKANTNGKKYTYKVVAKASTGTSTLSRSRIMYRVARTAVSSLASRSAGKMTVKWKRNSKANGYIVQYSKSKSFSSGNKTATITKNTLINKTIGSLTKGKKYYVRVRCFKTVSGKKYYSAWSAVKAVTVKK